MDGVRRTMRIGELAQHTGVSPRALRHYEQQGLLSPAREGNGYRVYDDKAIARAATIRDLLSVGLTTSDVHGYLDQGCLDRPVDVSTPCDAELETAQHRLASIDALIDRLQRTRETLAEHHDRLADRVRGA